MRRSRDRLIFAIEIFISQKMVFILRQDPERYSDPACVTAASSSIAKSLVVKFKLCMEDSEKKRWCICWFVVLITRIFISNCLEIFNQHTVEYKQGTTFLKKMKFKPSNPVITLRALRGEIGVGNIDKFISRLTRLSCPGGNGPFLLFLERE